MIVPASIIGAFGVVSHVLTEQSERSNRNVGPKQYGLALKKRTKNSFSTGALERRNPLPAGKYWIDIFEPKRAVWQNWVNKAGASIHILSTESFEAIGGYPARDWLLFETSQPLMWDIAVDIGWPTIAGPQVHTSDDTVDKPKPEPLFKTPSLETKIVLGGAALLVAAVVVGYEARPFK